MTGSADSAWDLRRCPGDRCVLSVDCGPFSRIGSLALAIGHTSLQSPEMIERILQLARFGAVGLVCFALGLAVLVGLHELLRVNYLLAYVASFVMTNTVGYRLNASFTFGTSSVDHTGAARYMLVNLALLCVNTAALKLLVDTAHLWYVAAAILLAVINTPISFLAHRLMTYRLGRPRGVASA